MLTDAAFLLGSRIQLLFPEVETYKSSNGQQFMDGGNKEFVHRGKIKKCQATTNGPCWVFNG